MWGEFLAWAFVDKDGEEAGRKADEWNRARNKELVDAGIWNPEQYRASEERFENQTPAAEQMQEAWTEGYQEGFDNVTGTIKDALNAPARFAWASIPWWIWLAGLLYLLHITGFLAPIMARVRKAASA